MSRFLKSLLIIMFLFCNFLSAKNQFEIEDNFKKPMEFKLQQNYPNPFNPTTTISYQLYKKSNVQLTIYDITGREIKTLINQNQTSGQHSTNFDASGLASGIYIYNLKAGNFEQSRKMLLLR